MFSSLLHLLLFPAPFIFSILFIILPTWQDTFYASGAPGRAADSYVGGASVRAVADVDTPPSRRSTGFPDELEQLAQAYDRYVSSGISIIHPKCA